MHVVAVLRQELALAAAAGGLIVNIEVAGSLPSLCKVAIADPYCVSEPLSKAENDALEEGRKVRTTNK